MSCRVLRASGWRVCELVCPAADWSVLREFLLGVAWSNLRVHGGTCGVMTGRMRVSVFGEPEVVRDRIRNDPRCGVLCSIVSGATDE